MTRIRLEHLLRAGALVIAIAGAIDPAMTSNHASRPQIAVVAIDPHHDSAQASRVRRSLERSFDVIPAALASADATVLVGDRVPSSGDLYAPPVFALFGDRTSQNVTIEAITAPTDVPLASHVPVTAAVRVTGARGRSLEVVLRAGDLVVDRGVRAIANDDELITVRLTLSPTAPGAVPMRITAWLADGGSSTHTTASADVLLNVRDTRWAVLFFDPRPSWMSTFVRRAIEADDRFVVTSRVVTSRNISTDAGTPPGHLEDLASMGLFDAVVVGAPDALSEADVSGLDAFMRRRGGSVVFLLDQWTNGPWQRLEGAGGGMRDSSRTLLAVTTVAGDSAQLRASEIAWPAKLPSGGEPIARTSLPASHSVVWRSAIGAGQLITSGALDAWRYRDPASSGFDRFWRTLIANAADAAPPPITLRVGRPVAEPGGVIDIHVDLRDPALQFSPSAGAGVHASVTASLDVDTLVTGASAGVSLWPDGDAGSLEGIARVPLGPGIYRVRVSSGGYHADVPIRVDGGVTPPYPREDEMLAAWAIARGGGALAGDQVAGLAAALGRALHPVGHPVRWHPMRSGWWIVPFAMALSGEWFLRRRRGVS